MERTGDCGGGWEGVRVFPADIWQEADGVLNRGRGAEQRGCSQVYGSPQGRRGTLAGHIWEPSPPLGLEAEGGQGCWNGTGQLG